MVQMYLPFAVKKKDQNFAMMASPLDLSALILRVLSSLTSGQNGSPGPESNTSMRIIVRSSRSEETSIFPLSRILSTLEDSACHRLYSDSQSGLSLIRQILWRHRAKTRSDGHMTRSSDLESATARALIS